MKDKSSKIIVLMVDGFGVPPEGWNHSVFAKHGGKEFINLFKDHSKPIDACLGVEGIPQSATGQSTLFTGINTPRIMGRHIPGFPGPQLKEIIREQNIFKAFLQKGKSVVFANAYVHFTMQELEMMGAESVTTVMTANTLGEPLRGKDLIESRAVYHDLTRKSIDARHNIKHIKPTKSAEDLIGIARKHDLTLFEYFLTDRAGHKGNIEDAGKILGEFSEFLCSLASSLPDDMVLLLTSDHGNCEDLTDKRHTKNPVPLLTLGKNHKEPLQVSSIADIYNFLLASM